MKTAHRKSANLLMAFVTMLIMLFSSLQPSTVSAQTQDRIYRNDNAETGRVSLRFNQVDTDWTTATADQGIPTPTPMPIIPITPEPETPIDSTLSLLPTPTPENAVSVESGAVEPLAPTNYYVNIATGNDSNSCASIGAPCQNIQEAINKAVSGDMIYVASGVYLFSTNGTSNVVIINKDITLSGGWNTNFTSQNGASTINGANANNGILANSGTVVVENFIIENTRSANSGAIYVVNGNFTLENSTLRNNVATASGAGIFIDNGVVNIINSTISGNTATGSGVEFMHPATVAHPSLFKIPPSPTTQPPRVAALAGQMEHTTLLTRSLQIIQVQRPAQIAMV